MSRVRKFFIPGAIFLVALVFVGIISAIKLQNDRCQYEEPETYSEYLEIDGISINYEIAGDPENPKLLFIHGWPMLFLGYEPVNFKPVVNELSQHFYVLAVTPPGILGSEPPAEVWSQQKSAEILEKLQENFDWQSSIIMGQSFGGGIASTFASLYPDRVDSLVLVDSATTNRAKTNINRYADEGFVLYQVAMSSQIVPLEVKKCVVYQAHHASNQYLSKEHIFNYRNMINDGMFANVDYNTISSPTILVWGEQDEITPISAAYQILDAVDDSELITLDGGHIILYEQPELVVEEIVSSLRNRDENTPTN